MDRTRLVTLVALVALALPSAATEWTPLREVAAAVRRARADGVLGRLGEQRWLVGDEASGLQALMSVTVVDGADEAITVTTTVRLIGGGRDVSARYASVVDPRGVRSVETSGDLATGRRDARLEATRTDDGVLRANGREVRVDEDVLPTWFITFVLPSVLDGESRRVLPIQALQEAALRLDPDLEVRTGAVEDGLRKVELVRKVQGSERREMEALVRAAGPERGRIERLTLQLGVARRLGADEAAAWRAAHPERP